MRDSILAFAALAAPLASAITLAPRSANPRVAGLDITRRKISNPVARDNARLAKRQSTVLETLDNEEVLYYANLSLGTPEQAFQLSIDTGSSDLWVNTATSSFCESAQDPCEGGTYDQASSSTARTINNDFNISYVDGSGAVGSYVSDVLHFGGVTLDDFQFGKADSSSSQQGVLGIGYAINEVQVNRAGGSPYPNLPQALVDNGNINTNAYSLWLNDLDASTGSILFGGVNSAKYTGSLVSVPIIPEYGAYYELLVGLSGVAYNGKSISSSNLPAAVLLDSGTSLTYLPDDIVETIYKQVGVVYDGNSGTAYAYCDDAQKDINITFTFSGQNIQVPLNELLLDAGTNSNGQGETFPNGKAACIFGVSPSGSSTPLLGDTFLRSAYVVYDLDNNEISLAQTNFNSGSDDVREITNSTGVPGATAAASPVTSVVAVATGGGRNGGATSTGSFGSNPTGAAAHQDVPAALSIMSAVAALFFSVIAL